MFTAGAESLIKQAREIQDEDLQKFYIRVSKLLHGKDFGNETVDCLQRLYLIVSATKYSRELPEDVLQMLQDLLCSPKTTEQFQALSCAILRESIPCDIRNLSSEEANSKTMSHVAEVTLAHVSNFKTVYAT
ncbi:AP-5 complex subunit zeta-1-like [Polyodon spathula]|uniref:AP-5 complex subunit zeta-1-like n=1 Tax=Polyodon spathula TaxID=7913 RepID=UPI001B7DB317|nr:AP-5 complex subunit zeta-1-like [Polyodon spathula]